MKIKSIKLEGFRRFKNLTIEGLPETARLVVMVGPNGSGKSSVFDALLRCRNKKSSHPSIVVTSYFIRCDISEADFKEPEVEFHKSPITSSDWRRSIHLRSAYRNDSIDILNRELNQTPPIAEEHRFYMLSENDRAVALNYRRILDKWIKVGTSPKRRGENIGEIQDEILGELRNSMAELFKDTQLILTGLGSPNTRKVFEFDKGTNHGLSYEHLSSGEKAALDMFLDIIVFKEGFNDAVFCIDEPEAHIHTKLQGPLLGTLYNLIPENSQLWIATHSIGMVRKAQDLWREDEKSVVFLDFGDEKLDFDDDATLTPTLPNPDLWARTYEIALGDLAKLVAPKRIILCESAGFDADCYNKIFGVHHPETRFIPIGSDQDVEKADENLIPVIQAVAEGAEILKLRDRDDADEDEIEENKEKGIRTLLRRNIESYLLDDEVLTKFCEKHNILDKLQDLLDARQAAVKDSIAEGKPPDDLKPTAQKVHHAARRALHPAPIGNRRRSFMKNHLALCLQPDMPIYEELYDAIFG